MAESEDRVVVRELRERQPSELRSLLESKTEELFKAKFKKALGQLRETHTLQALKKDIARIRTILGERAKSDEAQA